MPANPAPSVLDSFAATSATPAKVVVTYTETHAAVTDGNVTLQGVKRDSDAVPFVRITRKSGDSEKSTYDRADRVARYLQLLAAQG